MVSNVYGFLGPSKILAAIIGNDNVRDIILIFYLFHSLGLVPFCLSGHRTINLD